MCQTVWIQSRPDVLLGVIWVQTICKGYQQTIKVATGGEKVNSMCKILNTLYLNFCVYISSFNILQKITV